MRLLRLTCLTLLVCGTAAAQPFSVAAAWEQAHALSAAAPTTYLIEEDCEGIGTPAGVTDSGAVNWDFSTTPAQGGECAQFGAAGAEYSTFTLSAIADVWVFFAVRVDTFTAANDMIRLRDASSDIVAFRAHTSTSFRLACGGKTGTFTMAEDTWYYVWIHYVAGSGANGTCTAYISTTETRPGSPSIALTETTATASITAFRSYGLNTTTIHSLDRIRADDVEILGVVEPEVETAFFDGTNDRIYTLGSTLSDSDTCTLAYWMKIDPSEDATYGQVVDFGWNTWSRAVEVMKQSTDKPRIVIRAAPGGTATICVDKYQTTGTITSAAGWVHYLWAIDVTTEANCLLFTNGVNCPIGSATAYTNAGSINLDSGATDHLNLGSQYGSAGSKLAGNLAEFFFSTGYTTNVAAFVSGGAPVSPGYAGARGGVTPQIFLSNTGSGNAWATDSGSMGLTWTVTGALEASTDKPGE